MKNNIIRKVGVCVSIVAVVFCFLILTPVRSVEAKSIIPPTDSKRGCIPFGGNKNCFVDPAPKKPFSVFFNKFFKNRSY